jgi:hypothetical protein
MGVGVRPLPKEREEMAEESVHESADAAPHRVSRRAMLQAGTAGVVAVGAIGALPGVFAGTAGSAFAATTGSTHRDGIDAPAGEEPIVAHVKDASTGEVSLFVGEREITYEDRALVQHLIRATQ